MAEKSTPKADALRAMREARWAEANTSLPSSKVTKSKPAKPKKTRTENP